jgi:hypothetical protein
MGSFGTGNFENDAALDARQEVINHTISAIEEWLGGDSFYVEDADSVVGYVATLVAILENTRGTVTAEDDSELLGFLKSMADGGGPPKEDVLAWQKKVLTTYDDEIDDLEPDDDYKVGRRQVIADTFARLLALASD